MEKSKSIEKLFSHIVTYTYLILPLFFIILRKRTKASLILAVYGLVFFLLLFFYHDIPKEYRTYYQALYTLLEYFFFVSIFYLNIDDKKLRKLILILSACFVVFLIAFNLFSAEKKRVDSIPIGVESILIFIYIFFFFLKKLNKPEAGFIYSHYCFWISVGLLIYLGGSFFINISANVITPEEFDKYWYLNYIADTIKTLLFAFSFLFIPKKSLNERNEKSTSVPYLDMI